MHTAPPTQRDGVHFYLLLGLTALELLMSFSFFGYLHVEPVSITLAYLPVLLAGALLGPGEAAAMGTVFGLASMWKASANYVTNLDRLFSPIMSGDPLGSLLVSVGARALFGLVTGLLYWALRRAPWPDLWVAVVSYFGPVIHSLLVNTALWLFFPEAGMTPARALRSLTSLSNLAAAGVVTLCWLLLRTQAWRQLHQKIEAARSLERPKSRLFFLLLLLVTLGCAVSVAIYFVNRITAVLAQKGVVLNDAGYSDLIHLQIQFMLGILSLSVLVALMLVFYRLYTTYVRHEAGTDALTGALTRRAFFNACGKQLSALRLQPGETCYFLMADLDKFKEINDQFGHPEGDRALQTMAAALREAFPGRAVIGRLGGDEFAVLLYVPTGRAELESRLDRFFRQLRQVSWGGRAASCSMGVLPFTRPQPVEVLYRQTDRLLYQAKEAGRDRYVIGSPAPER